MIFFFHLFGRYWICIWYMPITFTVIEGSLWASSGHFWPKSFTFGNFENHSFIKTVQNLVTFMAFGMQTQNLRAWFEKAKWTLTKKKKSVTLVVFAVRNDHLGNYWKMGKYRKRFACTVSHDAEKNCTVSLYFNLKYCIKWKKIYIYFQLEKFVIIIA